MLPEPWVPLDLSKSPEPPEWIVQDFLARHWITLMNGREGSGKSNAYQALIGASLTDRQWLGRDVKVQRGLVVDEENPPGIVNQRLKAMGYDHERDADRLLYFSQIGCRLGEGNWGPHLLSIAEDFRPDLVVVDSMSSATSATNDNESITPLFRTIFKPLAALGCAVNLVHHERKAGGGIADRVSGGAQWLAQVDRQIGFEKNGAMTEVVAPGGVYRRSFPIKIVPGSKARQGSPIPETFLSIESESEPNAKDELRWMRLEVVDKPTTPKDGSDWRPTWYVDKVQEVLRKEPGLTFNAIHQAIGKGKREYTRRAVDLLIEEDTIRIESGARNAQLHYLAD